MPVDYQYDPKANIVHALPYAELSIAEIRGFFEALIQDDAVAFGSIEVVHFEKVDDFMFTSVEAQGIISALDLLRDEKGLRATVFVGERDLHFGVSRMLQILYELHDPVYPTSVVRREEELRSTIDDLSGIPIR